MNMVNIVFVFSLNINIIWIGQYGLCIIFGIFVDILIFESVFV